jgi:hypothetical protein
MFLEVPDELPWKKSACELLGLKWNQDVRFACRIGVRSGATEHLHRLVWKTAGM